MNENHQRHLACSFRYIDTMLGEADRILEAADVSPFARYLHDVSPEQRQAAEAQIATLRGTMVEIMGELGVSAHEPRTSALLAARWILSAARIALADIRPKVLRGYGTLSDIDTQRVEAVVADMDARLARLDAELAPKGSAPP